MSAPKVFHCKHLATALRSQRFQRASGLSCHTAHVLFVTVSKLLQSFWKFCRFRWFAGMNLQPGGMITLLIAAWRRHIWLQRQQEACRGREGARGASALNAKAGPVSWGCKILDGARSVHVSMPPGGNPFQLQTLRFFLEFESGTKKRGIPKS